MGLRCAATSVDDAARLASRDTSAGTVAHGWADGPDPVDDELLDDEPEEDPVDDEPVDDEPDDDDVLDEDVVDDVDPADDELEPGVDALAYPTGGWYSNTP